MGDHDREESDADRAGTMAAGGPPHTVPQKIVGVVGLGAMGRAIAANLVAAGIETLVWNRSPDPVRQLAEKGAKPVADFADILQADVVLSVLFDGAAVREIFSAEALGRARAGTIHVCLSTISTAHAADLAIMHRDHGLHYIAAPMFGRPDAAAAAKLNFALAGDPEPVSVVQPVLAHLGKTWPMGYDPRHGHAAKIAGNFLISTAIESMAEAAALLRSKAADPAPFLSMMGETLFASFIYRSYGAAIATGSSPGTPSGLSLPLKDNRLMLEEAGEHLRFPFAEVVRDRLNNAVNHGLGQDDWSTALATEADRKG